MANVVVRVVLEHEGFLQPLPVAFGINNVAPWVAHEIKHLFVWDTCLCQTRHIPPTDKMLMARPSPWMTYVVQTPLGMKTFVLKPVGLLAHPTFTDGTCTAHVVQTSGGAFGLFLGRVVEALAHEHIRKHLEKTTSDLLYD